MSIQQPRRFVTTDQGHADVLNGPIDTLYANDQELAAQVENIKKDPAGNGVASKEALDNHASNTDFHVTAAKQAAWSAAEANAKKYTDQYAAPKQHSHPASDLPSASTQARGIVQLNTSTGSTATDQAATPSAVKAANDRATEAYNRADQAFTQASDLKSKVANAITGKGGSANSGMTGDQLAASILNMPTKKYATGYLNVDRSIVRVGESYILTLPIDFNPSAVFVTLDALQDYSGGGSVYTVIRNTGKDGIGVQGSNGKVDISLSGKQVTFKPTSTTTSPVVSYFRFSLYQWWAYE
ncbi:tail fiber protein [Paenibacillus peoriae]|uniref:tail fiber protein n=1 Tax=Paenibacillus peoriae TaxID=59893 RepID=UPI003F9AB7D8